MTPDELAKGRFFTLATVRFLAIGIIAIGAANIGRKLLPDLSPWLGQLLFVVAAAAFFGVPVLLKRMWRDRP